MEEQIYKKMYLHLFNVVTDVLESGELLSPRARLALIEAQRKCEKIYMDGDQDKDK